MEKLKAILIDDDRLSAQILADLIAEEIPRIEIISIAYNGSDGVKEIEKHQPDLLFLDIEMPDMNGFEVLDQLSFNDFRVIFTTAHSQYAIRAFRFNALDYLLKPIDQKELRQAVNKLYSNSKGQREKIQYAIQNSKDKKLEKQHLILDTQAGYLRIALKDIEYVEGDRNYSIIHLIGGKKETSSKTLKFFEDVLSDKRFFRAHRSFLINADSIQSIQKDGFLLRSDFVIPISRRKKTEAKAWYLDYGS